MSFQDGKSTFTVPNSYCGVVYKIIINLFNFSFNIFDCVKTKAPPTSFNIFVDITSRKIRGLNQIS